MFTQGLLVTVHDGGLLAVLAVRGGDKGLSTSLGADSPALFGVPVPYNMATQEVVSR